MIFPELQRKAYEVYPALLLDGVTSHNVRNIIRSTILWILLGLLLIIAYHAFFDAISLDPYIFKIRGTFIFLFSLWSALFLLETMYLFYYFKDSSLDFSVAKIVLDTEDDDVTSTFLKSRIGQYAMLRLGISGSEIKAFLDTREEFVTTNEYIIVPDEEGEFISIAHYGRALLHFDDGLKKFLAHHNITPDIFRYTLRWVAKNQRRSKEYERWWTKDRLARIPSIGRNWSFGQVFLLEQFGHTIFLEQTYQHLGDNWRLQRENVKRLEQILLKERGANIMLVCEDDDTGMEVVASLAKQIVEGTALAEIESKRIFVLDGTMLIDATKEKANFEISFQKVLWEAANAGNVIVVIPHMARFADSASQIGSDVEHVLSEALESSSLQVIAIANTDGFHRSIETNHNLMRHFDKVAIGGFDEFKTVEVLEDEANHLEAKHKIFFTYPSLVTIAESADRFFSDGSMRNKAIGLLNELVPKFLQTKRVMVLSEDVLELVEQKTGIPQGNIGSAEKEKLDNLENILHERIVGQETAVTALSDSLRRARAGLTNPKRPMGSFLFLGPTGVGKTETTKALAETYFGNEDAIIRIDMSEYTGFDALDKLIGAYNSTRPGILASRLREKQYGVLLLDEFEKTTTTVMDLFLQILDEGYFSDGAGNKVIARNLIIVATSNAGSDLIRQAVQQGYDISQKKDEIVNALISKGIFKPELINRFDDVIMFHPLSSDHLTSVATLMIERLNKRLENKSITVVLTDSLLQRLTKSAQDTEFGAREMNRVVQDTLEKFIAERIIDGKIESGDTVTVSSNTDNQLEFTKK